LRVLGRVGAITMSWAQASAGVMAVLGLVFTAISLKRLERFRSLRLMDIFFWAGAAAGASSTSRAATRAVSWRTGIWRAEAESWAVEPMKRVEPRATWPARAAGLAACALATVHTGLVRAN